MKYLKKKGKSKKIVKRKIRKTRRKISKRMKGGNAVNELLAKKSYLYQKYISSYEPGDINHPLQLEFSYDTGRTMCRNGPNLQPLINYIGEIQQFFNDVLDKKGKCDLFFNDTCVDRLEFYEIVKDFFLVMKNSIEDSITNYNTTLEVLKSNAETVERDGLKLHILCGTEHKGEKKKLDDIFKDTFSDDTFDNIENKITKTQAKLPNKGRE